MKKYIVECIKIENNIEQKDTLVISAKDIKTIQAKIQEHKNHHYVNDYTLYNIYTVKEYMLKRLRRHNVA